MRRIELVSDNPRTYEVEDNMSIEQAAATYGRTEDSLQMYDENNNLIAYAAWKQGFNRYSFCHDPQANVPCDWDVLR
jgi:hypothetical protein